MSTLIDTNPNPNPDQCQHLGILWSNFIFVPKKERKSLMDSHVDPNEACSEPCPVPLDSSSGQVVFRQGSCVRRGRVRTFSNFTEVMNAIYENEARERQLLEMSGCVTQASLLLTGVQAAKEIMSCESQRVCPSCWSESYEQAFRKWRLFEDEKVKRQEIVEQSIVGGELIDLEERHVRGTTQFAKRVPVPHDVLGIALAFWNPPLFDHASTTPYVYHSLRRGDVEGTWAGAITSTFELWEGPYSALGSRTWHYNGGKLDAILADSLAYDSLRPVRLRITTVDGLIEQLPPDFSGTFVCECRDLLPALDALATLQNTSGVILNHNEPYVFEEDLFAAAARFPCLQHLKVTIPALNRRLAIPALPQLRAFCCDVISGNTEGTLGDAIASALPQLEVLHFTSPCRTDSLKEDMVHISRLSQLRVLVLRLTPGSNFHDKRDDHVERYEQQAQLLRESIPGLQLVVCRRHREDVGYCSERNRRHYIHCPMRPPQGESIDVCPVCAHQPLAQRIPGLAYRVPLL